MLYVEAKYPHRIGHFLQNFTQKKQYLWNFSCPYCGDISKGKLKKRGFIYNAHNQLNYKCHHCGVSLSFSNFMKDNFPEVFKEYLLENYKESVCSPIPDQIKRNTTKIDNLGKKVDPLLSALRRCDKLKSTHPAFKFLLERNIPEKYFEYFYYTTKFKKYINSVVPGQFKSEKDDHPRIVIPYRDKEGLVTVLSGRGLKNESPKYYIIKVQPEAERIFGIERLNFNKPIFVVEGVFDSLFLPNCIAISGASYNTKFLEEHKDNIIIVPDCEPRNKEVAFQIHKAIKKGFKISLIPEGTKDINEMILEGKTTKDILVLIKKHLTQGIKAELDFSFWKK